MRNYNYLTVALLSAGLVIFPVAATAQAVVDTPTHSAGIAINDAAARPEFAIINYALPDGSSLPVNVTRTTTSNNVFATFSTEAAGTRYTITQNADLTKKSLTTTTTVRLSTGIYQLAATGTPFVSPQFPGVLTKTQTRPIKNIQAIQTLAKSPIGDLLKTEKNSSTAGADALTLNGAGFSGVTAFSLKANPDANKQYALVIDSPEGFGFIFNPFTQETTVSSFDTDKKSQIKNLILHGKVQPKLAAGSFRAFAAQVTQKQEKADKITFGVLRSAPAILDKVAKLTLTKSVAMTPDTLFANKEFAVNGRPVYIYNASLSKNSDGEGGEITSSAVILSGLPGGHIFNRILSINRYYVAVDDFATQFNTSVTGHGTVKDPIAVNSYFDTLTNFKIVADNNAVIINPTIPDFPALKVTSTSTGQLSFQSYTGGADVVDLAKTNPATKQIIIVDTAATAKATPRVGGETINGTIVLGGAAFGDAESNGVIIGTPDVADRQSATKNNANVTKSAVFIDGSTGEEPKPAAATTPEKRQAVLEADPNAH